MSDVDPWLPARLRADAELLRGEQEIEAAVLLAVEAWLQRVREVVLGEGGGGLSAAAEPPPPQPEQWPLAEPVWVLAMEELILPEIGELFSERFLQVSRTSVVSAQPYVQAYLDEVASRLVLFPASAFEELRPELAEAISEGETMDQIRSRIESILDFDRAADAPGTRDHEQTKRLRGRIRSIERQLDDPATPPDEIAELRAERRELYDELHETERRWQWKARRIARTETIGAYNGGAYEGATFLATEQGLDMAKRWLATLDTRVRPTHLAAHEQVVRLGDPFLVGDATLAFPGDPTGPPHEVIQCRCTALFHELDELDDAERQALDQPPADLATISAGGTLPEPPAITAASAVTAVTAASGGPYTSAMIALVPSAADIERLVVPDGELPEDLHLTLAFLGPADQIDDQARDLVVTALTQAVANVDGPIEATGFSLSVFNPLGDEPCLVLGVGGPGLEEIRAAALAATTHLQQMPEQHVPWIPHVTLTYTTDLGQVAELVDRTGPITFDRLRLAVAGEHHDLTLETGGTMPDSNGNGGGLPNGWRGRVAALNTPTGDMRGYRRMLAEPPGGLRLRQSTIAARWQERLQPEHLDSVIVGMADRVWTQADPDGTFVYAEGPFDLGSEKGREAARLVAEGFMNGVSLDPDMVDVEERWYSKDTMLPVDVEAMGEDAFYQALNDRKIEPISVFTDWRVMNVTFTQQQALDEARIEPVWGYERPTGDDALTLAASAAAAEVHKYDPADFADPSLTELTPLQVTDDGRVRGHLAGWETCHTGYPGTCVTAPSSRTGYALFHVGAVPTVDGPIGVGKITLGTGHADPKLGVRAAAEHYDHTGTAVAVVRAGEDAYGIWVAGRLLDDVTPQQVETLMRSPLSGDWRRVDGNLELVGALCVNVPGFPVPRTVAASGELGEQVSLVAAGAGPVATVRHTRRRAAAAAGEGIDYARLAREIVREQAALAQQQARVDELAARVVINDDGHAARLARLDERIAG